MIFFLRADGRQCATDFQGGKVSLIGKRLEHFSGKYSGPGTPGSQPWGQRPLRSLQIRKARSNC